MGNEASKSSNNRMAVSAVAQMMRITKPQLLALRDKCLSVSDSGKDVHSSSGYHLTRLNFVNAMLDMNVANEPDHQILENLFVMWDSDGVDWVDPVSGMRSHLKYLSLQISHETQQLSPPFSSLSLTKLEFFYRRLHPSFNVLSLVSLLSGLSSNISDKAF